MLAEQRSYTHGPDGRKRDGATIEVFKSSARSKLYMTQKGFAPNYPDLKGAQVNTSRPTVAMQWRKRLADPEIKPDHARVTVRLTGEHLPPGTPTKWVARKTADDEWTIVHPNPYVYQPEEPDHD